MNEISHKPGDIYKQQLDNRVTKEENYIGDGAEKTVYRHPDRPDRVVGIFDTQPNSEVEEYEKTPQFIKARYYLSKIVNILYPQHFPVVHLMTQSPMSIEIDYVEHQKPTQPETIRAGEELSRQLHREIGLSTDPIEGNFVVTPKNTLVYVDTLRPWRANGQPKFDPIKLRLAVDHLGTEQHEQALSYFRRLGALYYEKFKRQLPGSDEL